MSKLNLLRDRRVIKQIVLRFSANEQNGYIWAPTSGQNMQF